MNLFEKFLRYNLLGEGLPKDSYGDFDYEYDSLYGFLSYVKVDGCGYEKTYFVREKISQIKNNCVLCVTRLSINETFKIYGRLSNLAEFFGVKVLNVATLDETEAGIKHNMNLLKDRLTFSLKYGVKFKEYKTFVGALEKYKLFEELFSLHGKLDLDKLFKEALTSDDYNKFVQDWFEGRVFKDVECLSGL